MAVRRATIDFETESIESRPAYPPAPVGLAAKIPGQPKRYFSWGHGSNNGVYELRGKGLVKREGDPRRLAKLALQDAYRCDLIAGQNISKFDLDVAETHMGVRAPPWHKVRDSLFSRFLVDPHAQTLSLKPSCESVLKIAPAERDAVYDWLAKNNYVSKPRIENGKLKYPKNAGAFISKAPGDLAGLYAIQDCDLCDSIAAHDEKIVKSQGMWPAYERELQVAPILLENERAGMRVDVNRLEKDLKTYKQALLKVEQWLKKRLNALATTNWDSDEDVAIALKKSGVVKEFPKTPTGRDSISKSRLTAEFYGDPDVYRALVYRNTVAYVISQNLEPWLATATLSEGRIFTQWQQVRSDREEGGGARSGRVTCAKWANIIKDPTGGKNPDYLVQDDQRIRKLIGLPPLPLARNYCLPDEGEGFGHADWSQQEIRLTAHYEEAELASAYRSDPGVDIHQFATDLINRNSGKDYKRAVIKHVNLRQFYGGGREGLVTHPMLRLDKVYSCPRGCFHKESNCDAYKAAGRVVQDWRAGLPGVVALTRRLSAMYERGEPIRTLGGRVYHCKPPGVAKSGVNKGRFMTFAYTALNYLIQPSGADAAKQVLIAYHNHPKRRSRLLSTVYDEFNISAPWKILKEQLGVLSKCMMGVKIDVPWKVDTEERTSWGEKVGKP